MSKRGENIYKRKDGRWEGRYIKERSADGKARYAYVYGKSYADAKQKLLDRRIAQAQNIDCSPSHTKYGDILRNWIAMSRVHIKESTYSRYIHLANAHILPYLGELPTGKLTTQTVCSGLCSFCHRSSFCGSVQAPANSGEAPSIPIS